MLSLHRAWVEKSWSHSLSSSGQDWWKYSRFTSWTTRPFKYFNSPQAIPLYCKRCDPYNQTVVQRNNNVWSHLWPGRLWVRWPARPEPRTGWRRKSPQRWEERSLRRDSSPMKNAHTIRSIRSKHGTQRVISLTVRIWRVDSEPNLKRVKIHSTCNNKARPSA